MKKYTNRSKADLIDNAIIMHYQLMLNDIDITDNFANHPYFKSLLEMSDIPFIKSKQNELVKHIRYVMSIFKEIDVYDLKYELGHLYSNEIFKIFMHYKIALDNIEYKNYEDMIDSFRVFKAVDLAGNTGKDSKAYSAIVVDTLAGPFIQAGKGALHDVCRERGVLITDKMPVVEPEKNEVNSKEKIVL